MPLKRSNIDYVTDDYIMFLPFFGYKAAEACDLILDTKYKTKFWSLF